MVVGERVMIAAPDNPWVHGQTAIVKELHSWGAVVVRPCGHEYRALNEELRRTAPPPGYTGDVCPQCGGVRMRRNGTCLLCEECGTTTGCS